VRHEHDELDPTIERRIAKAARMLAMGASEIDVVDALVGSGARPFEAVNALRAAAVLTAPWRG